MPAGLGNFFQVALVVFSLASLAGLGLVRSNVTNLRERITDYEKEVSEKDRRLTEAEVEIVQLKTKVNSQSHDLEAVGRLVRGESYWAEVGDKLNAQGALVNRHHSEAVEHWATDERLLREVIAALDNFTERGKS